MWIILVKLIITALVTIATVILLVFNLKANRLTRLSIQQMENARKEEFRPYVLFDMEFDATHVFMTLRNVGKSPAFQVQLQLDQDLKVWNSLVGEEIYTPKDMAITDEIEMITPGNEFREWVDFSDFFFRNNENISNLSGKVTYQDAAGNPYQFLIHLDIEPFRHRYIYIRKDMKSLVQTLERIRDHIKKL
ncbi:MAG: hypothetical protein D6805_04965 [Planctomycetota bacterium]|nr:MAG: hypothetical protein D6805_04965 [Planctomycetota bacterium]